jgi:hypothetical protein
MIVNAGRTVDKQDFFHKLKGLRVSQAVEQTLYVAGTKTGQKIVRRTTRQFRTFDPVDIQQLIHKVGQRSGVLVARSTSRRCLAVGVSGVGRFFLPHRCDALHVGRSRDVFGRPATCESVARFTTKSLYTE